ncbi:hypothetical protein ABTN32_20390, partial [Acinetobacter baumannii]
AFDFFREKARVSTDFDAIRKNKQRDYEILQKRAKSVKATKDTFNDALSRFFESARSGEFELACEEVRSVFAARLKGLATLANPVA